ncbi:uncharacterized protein LOC135203134 isoform X4 [Macrobrachium nipponense]|uniref:uncharacterized protein LOC135203134 isoform X4 n=1 Tax=Macrobrachium nipponense TaxID=159736 RepID=UPI0030C892C6
MPRYAYQKPRAKVYAYNFGYMNNYYKPMTHYLSKEPSHPTERPGAQCLAERLKKFPMDGSIYHERDEIYDYVPSASVSPRGTPAREIEPRAYAPLPVFEHEDSVPPPKRVPAEEGRRVLPLHLKHPYRLPVEDEVMPLHESSIWPEGRKHFDLVSSYDLMCGYLGLCPYIKSVALFRPHLVL